MQPQIHLYLKIRCTRPLHTNSFTRIIFICAINRNLQLKLFINETNPEQIIIFFLFHSDKTWQNNFPREYIEFK